MRTKQPLFHFEMTKILIPGRGEKFVKVGPSRHTGRDTNHHGVGADPTMDDFESRQTTP